MRNRQKIILFFVLGCVIGVFPSGCWALSKEVAEVLARVGEVIQCNNNVVLLENELRLIPNGLVVMDSIISEYVKQVAGNTRSLQSVTIINIAVIKYTRISSTATSPSWLLCVLDNIDDPMVMDEFLHTSKHDRDRRCSLKSFANEKIADGRVIAFLTDPHNKNVGTVTVSDKDAEGLITLKRNLPATQPNDADEIIVTVGQSGTMLHPQSRCHDGNVPVAVSTLLPQSKSPSPEGDF